MLVNYFLQLIWSCSLLTCVASRNSDFLELINAKLSPGNLKLNYHEKDSHHCSNLLFE